MAVYRHELANFQTKFQTNGAFFTPPGNTCTSSSSSGCQRFFPVQASLDLKIIEHVPVCRPWSSAGFLGVGATSSQYAQTSREGALRFPLHRLL